MKRFSTIYHTYCRLFICNTNNQKGKHKNKGKRKLYLEFKTLRVISQEFTVYTHLFQGHIDPGFINFKNWDKQFFLHF